MHDARVLTRREVRPVVDAAGKGVGASILLSRVQPLLQRNSRLLHDLELNWTAGFMLDNRRSLFDMAACRDVIDPKADEIAAAQLTVDCKVEQREIALRFLI